MVANVFALASTVILLVFMGYFMLGSLPLLVLKHDTPLDARFIRSFFNLYYRAVLVAAVVAAGAYGLAGQVAFSVAMAVLAAIVFQAKRVVVPRMDALRERMVLAETDAIAQFRRVHVGGMLLNVAQLAAVAAGLLWLKL